MLTVTIFPSSSPPLIQVTEIQPPSKKPFDEVKRDVAASLLRDRATDAVARAQAEQTLAALRAGKKLEALTIDEASARDTKTQKPVRADTAWILSSQDAMPRIGASPELHAEIFALKSEQEQEAIIFGFQEFLNALSFPAQILVTSRAIDIAPYMKELDEREELQESELMKIQLQEYREYIKELVKVSNVMTKNFYIIIPFAAQQVKDEGGFAKFLKGLRVRGGLSPFTPTEFERYKDQLWQRVEQVVGNLRNIGVRLVPLNTQEIIELFYSLYNPDTSRSQRLPYVEDLELEDARPEALAEGAPSEKDTERFATMTKGAPDLEEAERRYREHQSRDI
jgi:hypothetical protein